MSAPQPPTDPARPPRAARRGVRPAFILLAVTVLAAALYPAPLLAVWERVMGFIGLKGEPVLASFPVISEHEIEELRSAPPQEQAARLLERAINGYRGANDLIEGQVDSWRGQLRFEEPLQHLVNAGINSSDLRVRAAALEISLATYGIEKTPEAAQMLMDERQAGGDVWTLWCLGLLAGRGVEPNRIFDFLVPYLSDPDPNLRYWAIEGLAYSGDERMIPYLLGVLHDDPSPKIRERAACSLAQSGMLPAEARFQAVPTLLDFSDDPALDATTHRWVFQALRDITGQSLPPDSGRWRDWWSSAPQSRQG